MVTTVTASTVEILAAANGAPSLAQSLTLVAVLLFLSLLIQKEIVSAGWSRPARACSRGLNIALVPLGLALLLIVTVTLLRPVS